VQFSLPARVFRVASRHEDFLLSSQPPPGAAWRESARTARAARLGIAALALGVALGAVGQPRYALLGVAAPDFALHASVGDNVRLSEHRGEVVVVSFWSSRCTPCRNQLAALNRSFQTYRSAGLQVYGVGVDDEPAQALEFARTSGVSFPMLLDPSKGVARSFQVDNLPMTVLIDRSGVVRHVLRDFSAASEPVYLQELRALLNE
jgi:peroxiredoxin